MKKILLFAGLMLFFYLAKAQTYDTTTYYGKMSFIFNNISRTQITTGLLQDYGVDFVNPDVYTGKVLNDTNWVTLPDWRSLYGTLYSDQITAPAAMPGLDSVNRLISRFALSNLPVTFTCLNYNFNVLDTNAANKNLVTVSAAGQLNDVIGRTQSPYLLHNAFAIASTQQHIITGSNQLIFRPELFMGNTGKTISTLQVDPKGTGTWQTASFNTAFTVSYDTAGIYALNFKITYTDGSIYYSHTKLAAHSSNAANKFGVVNRIPVDFTADKTYLSVLAKGDYIIDYSVHNSSGTIQKPLIIISGFDPEAVEGNDLLGLTFWNDYKDRINNDINLNPSLAIPLNGDQGLDDADSYDLIYLHWHNGTDYIQRNAYLLEKLIAIVNNTKTLFNGVRQQNVIIGTSMGGIVARYALRDMELTSVSHETRLFISHDAPQWGANVPPAFQAMVQYIAPWKILSVGGSFPNISIGYADLFPDAVNAVQLFNTPAAKQMLLQRYTLSGQTLVADNSTHTSFMTELNNMGWPVNCKNATLSNGACNGTIVFPENAQMLTIAGTQSWTYFGGLWRSYLGSLFGTSSLNVPITPGVPVRNLSLYYQFPLALFSTKQSINFDFGAWAVPVSGTSLIFKGDAFIKRKILWTINTTSYILKSHVNSVSGMLSLDNAPGGKYDVTQFGLNEDAINTQLHKTFLTWVNATVLQKQFCFVPTVSALAVINPEQNFKASICDIIPCLLPASVKDFYAPQQNELHISYTTNNSNWILQRQNPLFNCSQICPASVSISGASTLCSSSVYSVANLPADAAVTWSISPSIANLSCTACLQPTLTLTGNGNAVLTASITNSCSSTPLTITKQIAVGNTVPNGNSSISSSCRTNNFAILNTSLSSTCTANISIYFTYNIIDSRYSNLVWTAVSMPAGAGWSVNGSSLSVHVTTPSVQGSNSATVHLSATGPCGAYNVDFTSAAAYIGGFRFAVSPNPAQDIVTVSTDDGVTQKNAAKNLMYGIKLTDETGILKKSFTSKTGVSNTKLSLGGLKSGVYLISVYDGNKWSSKQLIIRK